MTPVGLHKLWQQAKAASALSILCSPGNRKLHSAQESAFLFHIESRQPFLVEHHVVSPIGTILVETEGDCVVEIFYHLIDKRISLIGNYEPLLPEPALQIYQKNSRYDLYL